ncbi:MAG: hypothetical protein PGN15_06895 [Aeromicrobium erythreum]
MVAAPATGAPANTVWVHGHSWTTGYGLADTSLRYPKLVATARSAALRSRGVDGSLVHEAAERLYGTGGSTWTAGAAGDVVIQANLNSARQFGADRMAVTTSRNALRVMLATINASKRVENTHRSHVYSKGWRTRSMGWASGGSVRATTKNGSYVGFKAVGGEYVSLRGVSGTGVVVRISDRTSGRTIARINTGRRVHRAHDHAGIPLVFRIPPTRAGHSIRMTKESGSGSFTFDARLPQRRSPGKVVLVKEPYLEDYSLSTAYPNGSDAALDAFNTVLDQTAAEFRNAVTVDPNAAGWDPTQFLQTDGVHPNEAGNRFLATLVGQALRRTS